MLGYEYENQKTKIINSDFKCSEAHIISHQYLILCILFIILAINSPLVNSQEINSISFQTEDQNTNKVNGDVEYKKAIVQANSYYKNKRYQDAIYQYELSLKYLSRDDKTTRKRLGNIYTKIAESYKRLKNREKTAEFYKKSLDIFTILNNKNQIARTLKQLAESERYLNNLMLALDYSMQSLTIYETLDDLEGHAKALMSIGITYRHINLYEKSLIHTRQAYDIYKKIKDHNGITKASNEIGNLHIRLEQFKQAKYFFQETINTPKEKLELKTLASALKQMAVVEFKTTNYKSAMFYAQKAYKIYQEKNEELKESSTARVIGNIYRAQGNRKDAITFYEHSLSIAIKNKNSKLQIEAQIPLAHLFIKQDTNKAVSLLLSALDIAIRINDDKQTFHTYNKLRMSEESRGDYKKALYYAKKEIAINDLIQKKSEKKKLTVAKAALYSHQLEIELESLREKTKLDQLELTKKSNEIEIGEQAQTINELKLTKNKYASIALAFLLIICVFLIFFIYRNFINSKKRNKELDYLASRDYLTSCHNRRSLLEMMNQYFATPQPNKQYCVLMVDIDNFKKVNDTYGHNTGDTVIRGFASILQSCINPNDIVARYGGEEFCIVLHRASLERAMEISESMRHKVEHSTFDDVNVTSSFGITSLEFGAQSPFELIEQADLALYKSKSLGRNKVTLWEKSLTKKLP